MASFNSSPISSSSKPTRGWTYDVFLSFRGKDTRYKFVDHLYAALLHKGIHVFKDEEMLQRGKLISPELVKAIEESRFAVVVFPKNYADSSWCLIELAKIMECRNRLGQRVLPVFYHVDPSDVRGQKRDFDTAFLQHEEKFGEQMDKVNEWREALTAAANLSGYHISKTVKEGEYAFTNNIVQEILSNIQPRGIKSNLIGMESRMNELNSLLDTEATQEVRIIGICGMGGIGKTTLAQAFFKRISFKFEGSSFVKGVSSKNRKRDICALQEEILKDVTQHRFMIKDPEEGAEMIQTRFCNKKVLLVLDDVDDAKQLEFLAATHEWFGAGSRIIITTRDERLLSYTNAKYKPPILIDEQAVELFSRHAFRKNSPPEGYEELSNRAIQCTGYLPLALKVLGSFFHGRQASVWHSALNRLAKTPNREIFETLKISFDGLEVSEKQIFLDIACFFKGNDEERVTRVLDSFGFDPVIGISVLVEKSLITISNKRLDMHDCVQEMGMEIVRQSYPISRLWQLEKIQDLITKKMKLKAIEAIVDTTDDQYDENVCFNANVFEDMKNLRLLDIRRKFTTCEPTFFPDELRWLRWDWYPFSSLPVGNMCKLVGIEIKGGIIEHLRMGQKVMPYLKFIHLQWLDCLERFPDISGAPNVMSLILKHCRNLMVVDESLGYHKRLVFLNMHDCTRLKCLPSMIEMESLETLDLSNCCSLEKIPEFSPCMVKLSNIYLDGCSKLKNIPNSICELKYLKSLHLHNCVELQKLPKELGNMEKLEELWMGITSFPMTFGSLWKSINSHTFINLCYLRKVDLRWRQIEDKDLLNNLHSFSELEELYLSGNSKLVQLPQSISRISRLLRLELNDCPQLQNIQALPSGIQVLKASNCKSLEKIEDLRKEYVWLCKIWLSGCNKLLENQENVRCIDEMFHQSFLKKCAALDRRLSIAIPGSKIPSWFKEQRHGYQIGLKLPPKCHGVDGIMGFAVCGVFQGNWITEYGTSIFFKIEHNDKFIPELEVDCINASPTVENESVQIAYIPFSFFQQHIYDDFEGEDWSLFVEGNLIIRITTEFDQKVVRCGAHIVYKEDVESMEQTETSIPRYGNSDSVYRYGNTFMYEETF